MESPEAMIRISIVIAVKKCRMSPICLPIQKTTHPKMIPRRMPTSPPMTVPTGSSPVPTAPRKMRVSRPSRKVADHVRKKIVPQFTSPELGASSSSDEVASDCAGSSTAPNLDPVITTLPVLMAWALTLYLALNLAMNPTASGSVSSTTSFLKSLFDHLRSRSANRRNPIPRYVRKIDARSEKTPSKIFSPSSEMIVAFTE
mmetsp:Transcript_37308/g.84981  ORF Transcript_37308/g.84981 Transcript_37308/m.84981 type:complete len:201 (+) Transcript_37308:594-1196(+)